MAIKVFVRQPLTQTGEREARVIQAALDGIGGLVGDQRYALEFLTGTKAHDNGSFREAFASEAGGSFAPRRFRDTRLALLSRADVMLVVRTGLSESGAFEVAYNIFGGRRIPIIAHQCLRGEADPHNYLAQVPAAKGRGPFGGRRDRA